MAPNKIKVNDPKYYSKLGKRGGKKPTRGYFGHLKDHGETDKIAAFGRQGGLAKAQNTRSAQRGQDVLRGPAEAGQEETQNQDQVKG